MKTVFIWPSKIKSLGSSNMIKVKRIDDFFFAIINNIQHLKFHGNRFKIDQKSPFLKGQRVK